MDFNKNSVIITGAAGTGVAAGICEVLYHCNAHLILIDIDEEKLNICKDKYQADIVVGDIKDMKTIKKVFDLIKEKSYTVCGLVNNAGVGLSTPPHLATEEEFMNLFDIDIKSVWQWSSSFINHLLLNKQQGSIVNISSVHAHSTIKRYAIYAGAKSWVEGFTRGVAVQYGENNIRCNAVAPGYVHSEQNLDLIATWSPDPMTWVNEHSTDQQCLPYIIESDDCGYSVAFLLSSLSKSITGQVLKVDAGSTAMLYNNSFLK